MLFDLLPATDANLFDLLIPLNIVFNTLTTIYCIYAFFKCNDAIRWLFLLSSGISMWIVFNYAGVHFGTISQYDLPSRLRAIHIFYACTIFSLSMVLVHLSTICRELKENTARLESILEDFGEKGA